MILNFLTSELESADLLVRFLLTTFELFRVESITVGVMVREFVLSLMVVDALDIFVEDGKLILTGDFGSNGKNEHALLTVELGTLTTFGNDTHSIKGNDAWVSLLVTCVDRFGIARVIGF